ncbi:hypothetical protein JT104_00060 [Helicobacter pylori]|nr:hypothetical protein [Helicobacter pylori]
MRTSCARYECMGILYHELVAFIPNAKDDWDFCFEWLKYPLRALQPNLKRSHQVTKPPFYRYPYKQILTPF